jgi:3-oxoacyl-[acyl-carrier-protein] synthase II
VTALREQRSDTESVTAPRRVAVVGMGVATALGLEVDEVWQAVLGGRSGVRRIEQFPSAPFPVNIGSEVDFDRVVRLLTGGGGTTGWNRTLAFAAWAADRAWEASGLHASDIPPYRAATCVGAGAFPAMEDRLDGLTPDLFTSPKAVLARAIEESERRPHLASHQDLDSVSALLAARLGLGGPALTVHSACASATQAIGEAFHMIRHGRADVVLTGGADSMMSMFCVAGFTLLGALSRNPDPEGASRPFDLKRDGFVLGEGAGMVVLEELEQARRRGAPILAEIIGYGSSLDAYRFTDVHPQGRGAALCMRRALTSAAIEASEVDYVNAHGTSTYQNDRVETIALREVFGPHAHRFAVSSTKSQLGHLLCAAGGIEIVLTVLALREHMLPPTINLEHPDPECDLDYVANRRRPAPIQTAMSNSFGFGGQNGSLVVRRFEPAA